MKNFSKNEISNIISCVYHEIGYAKDDIIGIDLRMKNASAESIPILKERRKLYLQRVYYLTNLVHKLCGIYNEKYV